MRNRLAIIALALTFVVGAALPASAASLQTLAAKGTGGTYFGGSGAVYYYGDPGGAGPVSVSMAAEKINHGSASEGICVETWLDLQTVDHRPPDVLVNCRHGVRSMPPMPAYWITANGTWGAQLQWFSDLIGGIYRQTGVDVVVCEVSPATFARINQGGNCVGYPGVDVQGGYSGKSWTAIAALTDRNKPNYLAMGQVNTLPQGETMTGGDVLYSYNSTYRFVMQADGNVVKYDNFNSVLWQSHTAGHPGARFVFQGDGNLVVYDTNNAVLWASYTFGSPFNFSLANDGYARLTNCCGSEVWAA